MNVEIVERLRDAAREHGEVADLLQVLADCLAFTALGADLITCDDSSRAYLKSALVASQFVAYDRGAVAKAVSDA